MNEAPEFSLVIPTINEKANLPELFARVKKALEGFSYEIILVDDGSTDGTPEFAEELAKTDGAMRCMRRAKRNGLSAAIVDGFSAAKGKYIGVMDADLSHDPAILPRLIEALRGGAELAEGSRKIPGGGVENWPFLRKLYSNTATLAAKLFLGVRLSDPMSGYFLLTADLFNKTKPLLNPKGYKILLELAVRSQCAKTAEVPFIFKDRKLGQSKLTAGTALKYGEMLWDLRAYCPLARLFRAK